eukprot:Gb_29253 [translate_table: standard]
MAPPNIKDVLTSFSPSADFLAIITGDGRVKIWNTVNGEIQSEFADIGGTSTNGGISNGHLSLDYSCIEWSPLSGKKGKKKGRSSLLVLGTGAGDVLALDTIAGQLRWRANDCHPGGVTAISFASSSRTLYSTGADGMVCELDWETGEVLGKFRASKKAVSCMAVCSDGKSLATAGAELKLFNLLEKKKLQKYTGHPDSVRAMRFTQNGKHIVSCAAGERHVAVWECGGSKGTGAAAAVLSMEQPAVSLDCKALGEDLEGLRVLAVSETGVAYIWHSQSVEELSMSKPTKITASLARGEASVPKSSRNSRPCVFAARLQDVGNANSGMVLVAYGSLAKPTFERLQVEKQGGDIILSASENGALFTAAHTGSSVKIKDQQNEVTALGPENAEDAILPVPKMEIPDDQTHKKRSRKKRRASSDLEEMANGGGVDQMRIDGMEQAEADQGAVAVEDDSNEPTMEEKLMALGILEEEKENDPRDQNISSMTILPSADSLIVLLTQALHSDDNLLLEQCLSISDTKVMTKSVSSLSSVDALELLKGLVSKIKSRATRASSILPWIRVLLLQHASYIMSEASSLTVLNTLYQMIESRVSVFRPILQLSGRLDLIMAQISANEGDGLSALEPAVVYEEGSDEDEEVVDTVEDTVGNEGGSSSQEDEVMNAGMMDVGIESESDYDEDS